MIRKIGKSIISLGIVLALSMGTACGDDVPPLTSVETTQNSNESKDTSTETTETVDEGLLPDEGYAPTSRVSPLKVRSITLSDAEEALLLTSERMIRMISTSPITPGMIKGSIFLNFFDFKNQIMSSNISF